MVGNEGSPCDKFRFSGERLTTVNHSSSLRFPLLPKLLSLQLSMNPIMPFNWLEVTDNFRFRGKGFLDLMFNFRCFFVSKRKGNIFVKQ